VILDRQTKAVKHTLRGVEHHPPGHRGGAGHLGHCGLAQIGRVSEDHRRGLGGVLSYRGGEFGGIAHHDDLDPVRTEHLGQSPGAGLPRAGWVQGSGAGAGGGERDDQREEHQDQGAQA
jgi:hypothetical protein